MQQLLKTFDSNKPETDTVVKILDRLGNKARQAASVLAHAETSVKNHALIAAASSLRFHLKEIITANVNDIAEADSLPRAILDRLLLNEERIEAMAKGLEEIAALPDPIGTILSEWVRPNGLRISRVRVPLGVIGIIYESRPNVTSDASGVCLKAGNALILRGGSECFNSARTIMNCLTEGLIQAGLPTTSIQMIPVRDREAVGIMAHMDSQIDVLIPRGGRSLIEYLISESKVPLFKHLDGICHTYIHDAADLEKARRITLNAKMRRTGICGATETLLTDRAISTKVLPLLLNDLITNGCEIRGCSETCSLDSRVLPASYADWKTEYLDAILAVKIVANLEEAVFHINTYGSHHTDAIITEDTVVAEKFMSAVDSAITLHNASTQFADGGEFGMGAEVGISTSKFHARGPIGAEQLTSFKYKVRGNGHIRP